MIQASIIVLREGFEAFLIVAITLTYLSKIKRTELIPAVYWGIAVSVITSAALGWVLWSGVNTPLWEGVLGVVSAVLIAGLVVHMWRTAAHLKNDMETKLESHVQRRSSMGAFVGIFLFTILMISREGMETALLLIQVHEPRIVVGVILGILGAIGISSLWLCFGHLIDLARFFQITSIYLMLFVVQILIYSFHEFTEAGFFPGGEALHEATEPFSPDGIYGRWFSVVMIGICAFWLLASGLWNRIFKSIKSN